MVNFQDEGPQANQEQNLPAHYNITHEIFRMIPVRGPTIFDKQMAEFINAPASKSGMMKSNASMRQLFKIKAKDNEEASVEKEKKMQTRRKISTKAAMLPIE